MFLKYFLAYVIRKIGGSTLILWGLLTIILGCVAVGLADTVPRLDVGVLFLTAILGLLLSWIIADTALSERIAVPIGLLLGFGLVLFQQSDLIAPLFYLFIIYWWTGWYWWSTGLFVTVPLVRAWQDILTKIRLPLSHLFQWVLAQVNEQPFFDLSAIIFLWSWAVWLVAVWSAWLIRRRQLPFIALVPAGLLLVMNFAYVGGDLSPLVVLTATSLGVIIFIEQQKREQDWQKQAISFSTEIRIDIFTVVVPLILVVTILAASTPSISIEQISIFIHQLIWGQEESPLPDSLGLKPRLETPPSEDFKNEPKTGSLPRQHMLGAGPQLSQQVVMRVVVTPDSAAKLNYAPRYYWRAITYDYYTGQGWTSGQSSTLDYQAKTSLERPARPHQLNSGWNGKQI